MILKHHIHAEMWLLEADRTHLATLLGTQIPHLHVDTCSLYCEALVLHNIPADHHNKLQDIENMQEMLD
jgi:hypothetical protein